MDRRVRRELVQHRRRADVARVQDQVDVAQVLRDRAAGSASRAAARGCRRGRRRAPSGLLAAVQRQGQHEGARRDVVRRRLVPGVAALRPGQLAGDVQAEAGAVQPVAGGEPLKQLGRDRRVYALAAVADAHDGQSAIRVRADVNRRLAVVDRVDD